MPACVIQFVVGGQVYNESRGRHSAFWVQCALSASVADFRDAISNAVRETPLPWQTPPPPMLSERLDGAELITGWDKDGGNVLGVFQGGVLVPNDEAVRLSDVTELWGQNTLKFRISWPVASLRPAGDQPDEMVADWMQAFMGGDAKLSFSADGSCSGWIRDPSSVADGTAHMIFMGLGTWAITGGDVSFRWMIAEHGRYADDPDNAAIAMRPMSEESLVQFNNATLQHKSMTWAGQVIKKYEWH